MIAEAGVQKGVLIDAAAMLAIALMQSVHGPIIARFQVGYEDQVDPAMRLRGN